uniref:Cilia- and flagella-associated protein 206 n=1 Tax=Cryptomonas curvata TaxID=233186 RepID=A0A7S0QPW8_9CRYP|mmetsp:Transcript_42781/g.89464  ORF Transcript_42781/g.89464 Transcript_42781/m.89464 type:complete len:210 (+) Transcript_42781:2-631(+)
MGMRLELEGYCPATIARRDGLLLPAETAHGQVLYDGRLYGFVSAAGLQDFMRDPQRVLDGVLAAARKKPELINLVSLDAHFPHNVLRRYLAGLGGPGHPADATADAGCQTPTHMVEQHIDPRYDWNEWSLRRKALQLANLHTKRTHSTQTVQSHFRREAESQVYLPRAGVTQTGVERGTRPARHMLFLAGLRGHPDQESAAVRADIDLQ